MLKIERDLNIRVKNSAGIDNISVKVCKGIVEYQC